MLFAGIGLPLLTFMSGLYSLKKNKDRENRINRVVTKIMDSPCDTTSVFHRLLTSGVLDLETGKEIIEACSRIEAQGGKNPIPDNSGLSLDDLKPFFTYVSVNKTYLSDTPIQKVIKIYKDKMTLKNCP